MNQLKRPISYILRVKFTCYIDFVILSLAIKKEDALFLGVTEDVYDKYLDYVVRLNERLSENRRN